MENLSAVQWLCVAGMAGFLIVPRLGAIKESAAALLAKIWPAKAVDSEITDADRLAAYKILRPSLSAVDAGAVWQAIQPKAEEVKS